MIQNQMFVSNLDSDNIERLHELMNEWLFMQEGITFLASDQTLSEHLLVITLWYETDNLVR